MLFWSNVKTAAVAVAVTGVVAATGTVAAQKAIEIQKQDPAATAQTVAPAKGDPGHVDREFMKRFDSDGDGSRSLHEMEEADRDLGYKPFLGKYDVWRYTFLPGESLTRAVKNFKAADTNGDGFLEAEELAKQDEVRRSTAKDREGMSYEEKIKAFEKVTTRLEEIWQGIVRKYAT